MPHTIVMKILLGITLVVLLAACGYLGYMAYGQKNQLEGLTTERNNLQENLASSTERVGELSQNLASTTRELAQTRRNAEELSESLQSERERNEEFEDQIRDITGTVGQLDKLAKTDPELLQKYSKIYFLNEHYIPEDLKEIDKEYLYNEDEPEFLSAKVLPFFEDMAEDALDDDINLWVVSGFRSFDKQASVKGNYMVTYGSGANAFSADQGYSEHQLGTTVDFTTNGLSGGLQGFETTPAYEWLVENAHEYGFVLSYPEENGYYIFEPWHWRFVGVELAEDLNDDDEHFYDLDQRDIDEYLISIFD